MGLLSPAPALINQALLLALVGNWSISAATPAPPPPQPFPPVHQCHRHRHLPPSPFNQARGYNASIALTSDQRRGHGGGVRGVGVGAGAEPIHYGSCFSRWQPDDGILLRAPSIQH